jgi:hypothetical protein
MVNSQCRTSLYATLLGLASLAAPFAAHSQEAKPVGKLFRQLDRIDLGLLGVGEFNGSNSGTNYLKQPVALKASNTVGYGANLRYIAKPLIGFEFTYSYARYTNNFTLGASPVYNDPAAFYGVQSNAKEYTAGYVAHTPKSYFGVKPFAAVGLGTIRYQPTIGGGYSLPQQYRAAYYYGIGAETYVIGDHVGVRAEFRQTFHNAPDFLTDYLIIHQHTVTTEPVIGIFLRF